MVSINDWARVIKQWREKNGFETPSDLECQSNRNIMLGKLMLVVTEISEAAEAVRKKDISNFREELTDAIWRILDICETTGMDVNFWMEIVYNKNMVRPKLHGKKTSL